MPCLARIALAALAAAGGGAAPSPLGEMQVIVEVQRQTIVLLESEPPAERSPRAHSAIVGRILFQENHRRASRLGENLAADVRAAAAGGWTAPPLLATAFLDALETTAGWRGADRLAFRDVLGHARAAAAGGRADIPAARVFRSRLDAAARSLAAIEAVYGGEISGLLTRPLPHPPSSLRAAWEGYVAYVCSLYDRDAILRQNAVALEAIERTHVAGGLPESPLEISGSELPLRTVLLTFDDGPHARFTDRVLETLASHDAKAVFFEVGERVGRVEADEALRESSGAAVSKRALAAGMTIGNHSFSHPLMPRLSDEAIADEIEKTSRLLAEIMGVPPVLFRPPYGAADDRVLAAVETHGMRSVLWTVDSKDWADPIAASIAERVIREVRAQGCGIVLFHDIHGQTTEALPIVLDVLQASGFRFLAWNGKAFD